jgi:hypothetical protein
MLVSVMLSASAFAQTDSWRFRWHSGEVLTYRVEHVTSVAEVLKGSRVQTMSRLNLVKRWQVLAVDAQGTATLRLTLTSMRTEQTRPNGEVILFDSTDPKLGSPEMRQEMMKFLGKPLAELRVDDAGRVVEVKEGPADQYAAEPPFVMILPSAAPSTGKQWQRPFTITLAPPLGTGEKFEAVQTCKCTAVASRRATVALKTTIKNLPESPAEQIPLFQKQPEGEAVFDLDSGRLQRARLTITRDLQNHQGPGSSFHFESSYREELVPVGRVK